MWTKLLERSLALANDRTDLVVFCGVRLQGDQTPAWPMTKEIVPAVFLIATRFQVVVDFETIDKCGANASIYELAMGCFDVSKAILNVRKQNRILP